MGMPGMGDPLAPKYTLEAWDKLTEDERKAIISDDGVIITNHPLTPFHVFKFMNYAQFQSLSPTTRIDWADMMGICIEQTAG
jgi:hypothetical protein